MSSLVGESERAGPPLVRIHARPWWWRVARSRTAYLLILPTLVLIAVFQYYPAFYALYGSVFQIDYGASAKFLGLSNFVQLFHDPVFLVSIGHILALTAFGVLTVVTVPLAVAEWIFGIRSLKAQYVYRIIMVWPAIVPTLVTILIWQFIYTPEVGLLDSIFGALHLTNLQQTAWLGDPNLALYALMGLQFPFVSSLAVLIYLAGLENIPRDLMDAAEVDGATGFKRFLRIDLPMLKGQLKLNIILSIIAGLQGFIGPLVLTNGGPVNATMVPGLYMYQLAFQYDKLGLGSAIGVVIFLAVLFLTIANMTLLREERN